MNRTDQAVSCFKEGFSCSQAVVSTYGTQFGLSREVALRVSGGFGGGMGRMGEVCGALTGAFMIIGLKYGRVSIEDEKAKEKTYSLVNEISDRFNTLNGSIKCKDLLGCDISTPEGLAQAKKMELFKTVCPRFVRDVAEIIEQILE